MQKPMPPVKRQIAYYVKQIARYTPGHPPIPMNRPACYPGLVRNKEVRAMARLPLAALLAATTIASAQAGPVTFNASVGGVSDLANPSYFRFDALPPGITTTFSGDGGIVTGSDVGGVPPPPHAAPYLSNNQGTVFAVSPANGPQTSPYLSTGIGSATISFADPQTAFGILIGSGDAYNSISFESAGTTLDTFSGTDLFGTPTGDRGLPGTQWFNFHSTVPFNAAILASTDFSQEAGAGAIPGSPRAVLEPASGGLLLGMLGMLGLVGWRRKAG